jgi:copper resistance protein B
MKIKNFLILFLLWPQNLWADGGHGHDPQPIFHAFTLETDAGESSKGNAQSWDLDGWIGGDENKLWLRSEGKRAGDVTDHAEAQALYSRNIANFWDAQIGVRQDFESQNISYLMLGFEGLAPYFFETKAHIFLSDDGKFSARLRQEVDILITQRLIAQPYLEAELAAQDIDKTSTKAGLSEFKTGVMTRYEITRKFAPYFKIDYNRKTFATANLARRNDERVEDFFYGIGIRFRF